MSATMELIKARQQAWARAARIDVASGYVRNLDDNLFCPLNAGSRREFEIGAGQELQGDMRALHSSSALVVNVFDYWRTRDIAPLARAIGADPAVSALRFEATHPHGIGSFAPHLDVELTGPGAIPTAIESKFLEPYGAHKPMAAKYGDPAIWDAVGMPGVGRFARRVLAGELSFRHLFVRQLVAHTLGLAHSYGSAFRLLYLWYDPGTEESAQHDDEIAIFAEHVGSEVRYEAQTYQSLFTVLADAGAEHARYLDYLERRYIRPASR